MLTDKDIQTKTLKQLAELYNQAAKKLNLPLVVRFSDKVAAQRRVLQALARVEVKKADPTYKTKSKVLSRSVRTQETWHNPATKIARSCRYGVKVNGQEYRSVTQAFTELELPLVAHIRFRGKLREAGQLVFEHEGKKFKFEIFNNKKKGA